MWGVKKKKKSHWTKPGEDCKQGIVGFEQTKGCTGVCCSNWQQVWGKREREEKQAICVEKLSFVLLKMTFY